MAIKFGTSGWRAVISDVFTYANVRLVTQAVAEFDAEHAAAPPEEPPSGMSRLLAGPLPPAGRADAAHASGPANFFRLSSILRPITKSTGSTRRHMRARSRL